MKKKILFASLAVFLLIALGRYYGIWGSDREWPKHDYSIVSNFGKTQPYIPGTERQSQVKVQVLDASTMQPIAGAIVVGGYYAPVPQGAWLCNFSESAITDENGWATLPNEEDKRIRDISGGRPLARIFGPKLESAYKRGYQMLPRAAWKVVSYAVDSLDDKDEYWYISGIVLNADMWGSNTKRFRQPERYPDEKSALLAGRIRTTIYLYPSTARTKEERWEELKWMDGGSCAYTMPFKFSASEGALAAVRATYREMQGLGFTTLRYNTDRLNDQESQYLEFRQRITKEKMQ
jgi:hypothetical protein